MHRVRSLARSRHTFSMDSGMVHSIARLYFASHDAVLGGIVTVETGHAKNVGRTREHAKDCHFDTIVVATLGRAQMR